MGHLCVAIAIFCSFVPSPLPVSDGFGHSLLLIIFSPVWQTTLFGTRRVWNDCSVLVFRELGGMSFYFVVALVHVIPDQFVVRFIWCYPIRVCTLYLRLFRCSFLGFILSDGCLRSRYCTLLFIFWCHTLRPCWRPPLGCFGHSCSADSLATRHLLMWQFDTTIILCSFVVLVGHLFVLAASQFSRHMRAWLLLVAFHILLVSGCLISASLIFAPAWCCW